MTEYMPIILLGSERSGTNLLRALLSTHSKIASPPPCGILDTLAAHQFRYTPLTGTAYMSELIEDVITLTKTHMNPWDVEINQQLVKERIEMPSFWEVFRIINEIYADESNCLYWFSKEPGSFNYIYDIKAHLPNAKFIYMTRDGRDVASSMLKGQLHEFHIYAAANRWASEQRLCLNAYSDPLFNNQIFMVRYEDLIENAELVLFNLMKFLGLTFEPEQLNFHQNDDVIKHSEKSKFWKNLSNPIDKSNKGGYIKKLSTKQIKIFESFAWNEMKALDYPLENTSQKSYGHLQKATFLMSSFIRRKYSQFSLGEESVSRTLRGKAISGILNRTFENKNSK